MNLKEEQPLLYRLIELDRHTKGLGIIDYQAQSGISRAAYRNLKFRPPSAKASKMIKNVLDISDKEYIDILIKSYPEHYDEDVDHYSQYLKISKED